MMIKLYRLSRLKHSLWLMAGLAFFIYGCDEDEIVDQIDNNVAPVVNVTVADTVPFESANGFDVVVELSDNTPGLSSVSISIRDSLDLEVTGTEIKLFTTSETITYTVSDTLNIGQYSAVVVATDTEGLQTTATASFVAIGTLANETNVYILGSMNGWGGGDLEMTLVDDYTWERGGIIMGPTDEFKITNTTDWSDKNWGDDTCDGVASTSEGGNINNNGTCDFTAGYYKITFNDNTFAYTAELLQSNNAEMYMPGSMNGWSQANAVMTLVDHYTWELQGVTFVAGDEFKFANTSDWSDTDWGDEDCDGVMATPSGNTACDYDGTFTVRFNDQTLEYTLN